MRFLLIILVAFLPIMAKAVEPDEMLDNPALELRARDISKQLRCVVCQNQDIDSSNAGVARDLRLLVRERLELGETNDEIMDYVHARYGDYVLLKPPFKPSTYALWLAPPLLALLALGFGASVLRQSRRRRSQGGLSAEDEAELAAYLDNNEKGNTP
ncbi:cytochrome c-type biogenesis protein [Nereida ignava]|jgi:cytochrome c-type biogenesis protein CcmH|uniref:cytochrome c-type biogenesis protein n=1 Tax=Nereida ignava TaxID=282199 RepID=UPI003F6C13B2